jgi:hypothetical protein
MSNDDTNTPALALDVIDNGAILQAVDRELKRLGDDVIKNPLNPGERKLVLTLSIKPQLVPAKDGQTTRNIPEVDWKLAPKFPEFKGGKSLAFVDGEHIRVNVWDAVNPDQMGLSGLDPDDFTEEAKLANDDDGHVARFPWAQEGAQE